MSSDQARDKNVSIVVVIGPGGAIGNNGDLLWHIPEDLRHFKEITLGGAVVMGRKTCESLGRPLPNRRNVVITRQETAIAGCEVVHSLDEALALLPTDEEIFIIGGAQIYAAALPVADRFYYTRVEHPDEGDTCFPAWNPDDWHLLSAERFDRGAEYPYPFVFEVYERE